MGFPTFNWPDWRKAKPGTRIRNIQTGATGTFVKPSKSRHNGAIVIWDQPEGTNFRDAGKPVCWVSIAVDGEPITDEKES